MNKQELRTLLSQAEEDNNTEPIIYIDNKEEEIQKPYDEWYGRSLAKLYLEHADYYYHKENYEYAEEYYWKAYKTYCFITDEDLNESANCIAVLLMLANFYTSIGKPWKALTICERASKKLQQLELLKNEGPYWGWGLEIIILQGRIFAEEGYEEKAQYYYEKACSYL